MIRILCHQEKLLEITKICLKKIKRFIIPGFRHAWNLMHPMWNLDGLMPVVSNQQWCEDMWCTLLDQKEQLLGKHLPISDDTSVRIKQRSSYLKGYCELL